MQRTIVVLLISHAFACGHTRIASPVERNAHGDFESESNGIGTDQGDQWKKYAEGIEIIDRASADAAYVASLQATALWYVQAENQQNDLAQAPELVGEDLVAKLGANPTRVGIQGSTCTKPMTQEVCASITERIATALSVRVPLTLAYLDAPALLTVKVIPSGNTDAPFTVTGKIVRSDNGAVLAIATRFFAP